MKYFLAPFSKWSIERGVLQHNSVWKATDANHKHSGSKNVTKIKINTCAWMNQTFLNDF